MNKSILMLVASAMALVIVLQLNLYDGEVLTSNEPGYSNNVTDNECSLTDCIKIENTQDDNIITNDLPEPVAILTEAEEKNNINQAEDRQETINHDQVVMNVGEEMPYDVAQAVINDRELIKTKLSEKEYKQMQQKVYQEFSEEVKYYDYNEWFDLQGFFNDPRLQMLDGEQGSKIIDYVFDNLQGIALVDDTKRVQQE